VPDIMSRPSHTRASRVATIGSDKRSVPHTLRCYRVEVPFREGHPTMHAPCALRAKVKNSNEGAEEMTDDDSGTNAYSDHSGTNRTTKITVAPTPTQITDDDSGTNRKTKMEAPQPLNEMQEQRMQPRSLIGRATQCVHTGASRASLALHPDSKCITKGMYHSRVEAPMRPTTCCTSAEAPRAPRRGNNSKQTRGHILDCRKQATAGMKHLQSHRTDVNIMRVHGMLLKPSLLVLKVMGTARHSQ